MGDRPARTTAVLSFYMLLTFTTVFPDQKDEVEGVQERAQAREDGLARLRRIFVRRCGAGPVSRH